MKSEEKPKCAECGGSGWKTDDAGAFRCKACAPSKDGRLLAAGLSPRQLRAKFDAVHPQVRKHAKAIAGLMRDKMRIDGELKSLLLHGTNGPGKTWLAACALRFAFEELDWSVGFINMKKYIEELREAATDSDSVVSRIRARAVVPQFVVLDDMPRERITPFVREQTEMIFDERNEREKPYIITANPVPETSSGKIVKDEAAVLTREMIEENYGPAVASRLGRRFCLWIEVKGDDLREE